jgi:hypothetical protein
MSEWSIAGGMPGQFVHPAYRRYSKSGKISANLARTVLT